MGRLTRVELLGQLAAQQRIVYRKFLKGILNLIAETTGRGYVALAVASEREVVSREHDTGFGGDRTGNMVVFACEALKLLKEVINDGRTKM